MEGDGVVKVPGEEVLEASARREDSGEQPDLHT